MNWPRTQVRLRHREMKGEMQWRSHGPRMHALPPAKSYSKLTVYIYKIIISVLPKGRYFTTNSGTKVAVLLGMNKCDSSPLLSAPHSLFSIWRNLKRSEEIPGAPSWRWGEWIWPTGPFILHRTSWKFRQNKLGIPIHKIYFENSGCTDKHVPALWKYMQVTNT